MVSLSTMWKDKGVRLFATLQLHHVNPQTKLSTGFVWSKMLLIFCVRIRREHKFLLSAITETTHSPIMCYYWEHASYSARYQRENDKPVFNIIREKEGRLLLCAIRKLTHRLTLRYRLQNSLCAVIQKKKLLSFSFTECTKKQNWVFLVLQENILN